MSERIVKLIVCDRCRFECGLDYVGTDYLDGGFTKVNKFMEPPEGWKHHQDTGLLCPACNAKYDKLIQQFMGEDA